MTDKKNPEARAFNYKNLHREDSCIKDPSYPDGTNRYTLKGIASINISLLDVYYFYFLSIYKKPKKGSRDLAYEALEYYKNQKEFSSFFEYYLTYLMHQSLYSQDNKRTHHIRQLLDCIIPQQEYRSLRAKIDHILQSAFDQCADVIQKNKNEVMTLQNARKLKNKIKINRQRLINKIIDQKEKYWEMEYFPEGIINFSKNNNQLIKQIVSYLNRVCNRVENIMVVLQSKKKELLKRMSADLKNNIQITIPFLTKREKEKKSSEADPKPSVYLQNEKKQLKKQNEENQIILAKITKAVEPILTDMLDYLSFQSVMEKRSQIKEQKKNSVKIISKDQLVRDLIKNASRYYKNSNVTYPYLSIKDILFDQKGLKVHFKHSSLIYQGLALHKNTNSYELDLSTSPTPSTFDFQACYKEKEKEYIWQLQKKYLFPEIYISEPQQILLQNNQKQEAKIIIETHQQIFESIYIWRICCIIYYINHRKNMMRDIYNEYYSKKFNNPNPPFYTDLYQQHLKQTYHLMSTKPSYFRSLMFPKEISVIEGENNYEDSEQNAGFDFTMKKLEYIYGLDSSEDSMIARCNSSLITSQFACRILISKDIMSMMNNEKIFRRLINAKKYIIMFSVSTIEHLYQVLTLIYYECRKRGSRRKMLNSLRDYRDIYFTSEEEKRISYIKSTLNKLDEYLKRDMKDPQTKFLGENPRTTNKVNKIGVNMKQILSWDKQLNTYQHSMANEHNEEKDKIYMYTIVQILKLGEDSIIEAYKLLSQFTIDHIENKQPGELNKLQLAKNLAHVSEEQKKIQKNLRMRLLQSIKAFLKMRRKNIFLYNSSIIPRLLEGSKDAFKDLQKLKKTHIQQIEQNLIMVQEILTSENLITKIDEILPTWWKEQYKQRFINETTKLAFEQQAEKNSRNAPNLPFAKKQENEDKKHQPSTG